MSGQYEVILFTEVALILGIILGWLGSERFHDYMEKSRHHFEELFEKNPHPELYDEDGNLDRGEYLTIEVVDDFLMERDEDEYEGA